MRNVRPHEKAALRKGLEDIDLSAFDQILNDRSEQRHRGSRSQQNPKYDHTDLLLDIRPNQLQQIRVCDHSGLQHLPQIQYRHSLRRR